MPRRKPAYATSSHLRRTIASAAARLMAEEGVNDYGAAKRKAAHSLGADTDEALPTNEEIEVELRAYQAIYQSEDHSENLAELRRTAVQVMHFLAVFQPRLRGAVLDGTAGPHAKIELMLFADSSKDVEIWLLSHEVRYDIDEIRQITPEGPETRLVIEKDGYEVQLEIFLSQQARNNPTQQRKGRYRNNVPVAAVEALLQSPSPNNTYETNN